MKALSAKTALLTVAIALGTLMSSTAHAAILRTSDGTPVLTSEGAPVFAGTDGDEIVIKFPEPVAPAAKKPMCEDERIVYFDFNKGDLSKKSKIQLSQLAKKLHANGTKSIAIVGFADRMGNVAYNEKLALKRAKAVRDFLVAKGVKAKKVEVRSLGKSEPKAECAADMAREKLISCLAEDRRVEIEINGGK